MALEFQTILDIDFVPAMVREHVEWQSQRFIDDREYRPRNFDLLTSVTYDTGDTTYTARQWKRYSTNRELEQLTYLVDISFEGELHGYGHLRWNTTNRSKYFRGKPFVGYTKTEEAFRHRGYGRRRLELMNQLAWNYYDRPLYSDTSICHPHARKIWKHLVIEGNAVQCSLLKEDSFGIVL